MGLTKFTVLVTSVLFERVIFSGVSMCVCAISHVQNRHNLTGFSRVGYNIKGCGFSGGILIPPHYTTKQTTHWHTRQCAASHFSDSMEEYEAFHISGFLFIKINLLIV